MKQTKEQIHEIIKEIFENYFDTRLFEYDFQYLEEISIKNYFEFEELDFLELANKIEFALDIKISDEKFREHMNGFFNAFIDYVLSYFFVPNDIFSLEEVEILIKEGKLKREQIKDYSNNRYFYIGLNDQFRTNLISKTNEGFISNYTSYPINVDPDDGTYQTETSTTIFKTIQDYINGIIFKTLT